MTETTETKHTPVNRLRRPQGGNHKEGEFQCPECDAKPFSSRKGLLMHHARVHSKRIVVPNKAERERLALVGRKEFHCPDCGTEVTEVMLAWLKREPQHFRCPDCGGEILEESNSWVRKNQKTDGHGMELEGANAPTIRPA